MKILNGVVEVQVQRVKTNIMNEKRRKRGYKYLFIEPRSASMTRYPDASEPVRGPSMDNFVNYLLLFSFFLLLT